jgi:hypothetical protein
MKFVEPRAYADPEVAARKIMEIANSLEPYMDGRLLTEKLNAAMLYKPKPLRHNGARALSTLSTRHRSRCYPRRQVKKKPP